jgi:hypothetical protein
VGLARRSRGRPVYISPLRSLKLGTYGQMHSTLAFLVFETEVAAERRELSVIAQALFPADDDSNLLQ